MVGVPRSVRSSIIATLAWLGPTLVDVRADAGCIPLRAEEAEICRHVHLVEPGAIKGGPQLRLEDVRLPDHEPGLMLRVVGIKQRPDLLIRPVDIGVQAVHDMELRLEFAHGLVEHAGGLVHGVIPQLRVFHDVVRDIEAKTIDTSLQPEAEGVEHRLLDLGVAPVQVRLLREESMEIVLAGFLVKRPGGPAEDGKPVVWGRSIRFRVAPIIPIPLRTVATRARFDEPRVLVRGVVGHEIDDYLETARVGDFEEVVEVGERSEERIDVAIVRNVVPEVDHGRGVEGRDPERVDAEPNEVIEPVSDSAQVARAVPVAVLKAARVNLIDDAALPPGKRRGIIRWEVDQLGNPCRGCDIARILGNSTAFRRFGLFPREN
jgi:hypothetical protein